MSDLIKRLRSDHGAGESHWKDCAEAADLLKQQAARIAELEARGSEAVAWLYEADGKRSVTLMDPEGSEAIAARAGFKITPLGPITNSSTGDAAGKNSVDAAKPWHWNPVYNIDPVQRACAELPLGWEIQACMEQGAGWVNLFKPNGDRVEFDADADCFDWSIHAAIDAAIASLTKTADGEKQS